MAYIRPTKDGQFELVSPEGNNLFTAETAEECAKWAEGLYELTPAPEAEVVGETPSEAGEPIE